MKASRDDLNELTRLQQIDLEILKTQKQLDGLPQRMVIFETRQKREEIESKREQIIPLKEEASKRLKKIVDENDSLAKKEEDVQSAIDALQGDYRSVEARTKELDGIAKRRAKLADDRAEAEVELNKIVDVESQIELVDEDLKAKEATAVESFQSEGSALKKSIAELEAQRKTVAANIDEELLDLYDKTRARSGGVAIGPLKGSQCGVCRATIDGGRLLDLKTQAPLGICPACQRLLIIE